MRCLKYLYDQGAIPGEIKFGHLWRGEAFRSSIDCERLLKSSFSVAILTVQATSLECLIQSGTLKTHEEALLRAFMLQFHSSNDVPLSLLVSANAAPTLHT